jgi:hypothetical protein
VDGLLRVLVAVVAALNAATGAPMGGMPDRPPIMVPTLAPLPTLPPNAALTVEGEAKTTTFFGTITNIQDGFVFVNGVPVRLGPATLLKGQLRAGLDVQVQAKRRADGFLEADELDLDEKPGAPSATTEPAELPHENAANQPLTTPTAIQESNPSSPQFKPTEYSTPQAAEKPEVKAIDKAAVEPTEKANTEPTQRANTEPTGKPEVHPTARPNNDGGKTTQGSTSGQTNSKEPSKRDDAGKNEDSGSNRPSGSDGSNSQSGGD